MTGFLLDTNVISELTKPSPEAQVLAFLTEEPDLWIPAITLYELRFGVQDLLLGRRREQLQSAILAILVDFGSRVIPLGREEAEEAAILQAFAKSTGNNIGLADCLIAGTARVHDLCVVTRNVKDFDPLDVAIHNPWPQ